MSRKVLFVSQYADPKLVGGNNNVYRQAIALRQAHDVDVEILTWPEQDHWSGPVPSADAPNELPYLAYASEGLTYHVIRLPKKLLERVLTEADWNEAVEIGCKLLRKISPTIVHLQHWRGLWWILESAKRLSIPTVYSAHDWGIGCLRTILVKGEGGLCDGIVEIDKCAACIWHARNLMGKANELLVSTTTGERFIQTLGRNPTIDRWLSGNSAVRIGLKNRVAWNLRRAQAILSDLSALIVPNAFARSFYMQFGVSEDRIFVQPWYYDLTVPVDRTPADSRTTVLGYIGRISPEKGVQRIFEALLNDTIAQPVHLVVAGAIDSAYATQLHSKYRNHVGKHSVEWMGWLPHADVDKFYQKVDAVIISSEWIENGPLTLIESYAFKRPVIATDTPTSRDLVRDGETGYLVTFSSTESLAKVINRVSREAGSLYRMRHNLPTITTSVAYAASTKCIYETIALLKIHALKI